MTQHRDAADAKFEAELAQAIDEDPTAFGIEPCPICKGDGELMPGPILCMTCDGYGTVTHA